MSTTRAVQYVTTILIQVMLKPFHPISERYSLAAHAGLHNLQHQEIGAHEIILKMVYVPRSSPHLNK